MSAVNESVNFSTHEVVDDLLEAIKQGRMTQADLLSRAQQLESTGEIRAASNLYALWINHAPSKDKHFALFNYASLLQGGGRPVDAMEAYEFSINLNPSFAQPYINLGLMHEKQGNDTQALQTWLRLVGQRYLPNPPSDEFLTMALNHMGRVQEKLKNYLQAEQALEESLAIDPKQPGVIQHWVHIRQKACQWPVYKPLPNVSYADMRRYTSPLAMLAMTEDPAEQLLNSQSFVARTYGLKQEHLCEGRHYEHSRLRVGYVSGDFREHAVGFLLPGLLDGHDKDIELFAYDFSPEENTALRQKLKQQFDHFRSIHTLSDRQAAELVLADEIDVLIDLHGLSSGARPGIFALRPAPKQGTFLGFMGPTGMPWIDFVVADKNVLPEELTPFFTEKPLYVEGSFIPRVSYAEDAPVLTRQQLGLPDDAFVMASFGNTYKITPEMFATWMRLLHRLPNAVLWLIDDNEASTANLSARAAEAGVDVSRIHFSPRTTHSEFCGRLKLADVFLDTYPYNCGSTANDVLNANLQMVTMHGRTLVSRMGLSLLKDQYFSHGISSTIEEYYESVIYFCKNKFYKIDVNLISKSNFSIGEKIKNTILNGSFDCGHSKPAKKIKAYQICYDNESLNNIPDGFLVLDNTLNDRPDWREFWPIYRYLSNNELEDNTFYGFFSPKFNRKTGLNFENLKKFADLNEGSDVLIFSPFWDHSSYFMSPFEQGDCFHDGLLNCSQRVFDSVGVKIQLNSILMDSDNSVFCNYFLANKKFWDRWLEIAEKLFDLAEKEGPLSVELNANTLYGEKILPMKIFIQERLVNGLLFSEGFSSRSIGVFDLPSSVVLSAESKKIGVRLDFLKRAYRLTEDKNYFSEYLNIRNKIFESSGVSALVSRGVNSSALLLG